MTLHVTAVHPAGAWNEDSAIDRVLIDFDRRHRRRIVLPTEAGAEVLIDLPHAVRLRDGDGLALDDERMLRVVAQPEALLEIHAHGPAELVRIAWHLGNRHLPVQLLGDRIRIRADHVIADMVHGLGGHAHSVSAPFDPEGGAYLVAATRTPMTTEASAPHLLALLTWLSPAFPTGAYAYSHGLEWAVEMRDVQDEASSAAWIADVLTHGAGRSDAILLRHAYRASTTDALLAIADLGSRELSPGRNAKWKRWRKAQPSLWQPRSGVLRYSTALPGQVAYPVALGALAAAHAVPEDAAALGMLQAFAANLVSAAVRLVPLGQTAGLRILAGLASIIAATAQATRHAPLDDIGGACFRSDIAAMRHETQYTRLFRT